MNDMTNMPCIDVESVAEILELSPGHPERRHAETCPRCRSLVDSYRSFIEAQDTDGSGIDDVRGALTAAVQKDAVAWSDRMPGQLWQRRVPRRRRSMSS